MLAATGSGSFNNVNVTDTITSDSGSFGRVIGSIGSTNGVVSGSVQVDHDSTTNYVDDEHIDHSTVLLVVHQV